MPTIAYVPNAERNAVVDTGECPRRYVEVSSSPRFVTEYVAGRPILVADDVKVYEPHHWLFRGKVPTTWEGIVERVNAAALDKGYYPFTRSDTGRCTPRFSPFHESVTSVDEVSLDAHDPFTQASIWRPVSEYFNFLKRSSNPQHQGYDAKTGFWHPYVQDGVRYIGYRHPAPEAKFVKNIGMPTNTVEVLLMRDVQKAAYTLVKWLWENHKVKFLLLPQDAQTLLIDAVMTTGGAEGWESLLTAIAKNDWAAAGDALMTRAHTTPEASSRILEAYEHWVSPNLAVGASAELPD